MKIRIKRARTGATIEFKVDKRATQEGRDLKEITMAMVTAGFDFHKALQMLHERGYELDETARVGPDLYVIKRKQGEVSSDVDPL